VNGCSFSAWVNPIDNGGIKVIIGRVDNVGDNFFQLYLDHLDRYVFWIDEDGDGPTCISFTDGVTYDEWFLFTGVYDSVTNKAYTYRNGVELDNIDCGFNSINETAWQDPEPTQIGIIKSDTYPFNGLIDEVIIHNKALSPTEVSELYNSGDGVSVSCGAPVTCPDATCDVGETCVADSCCNGNSYNAATQVCCSGNVYVGDCCLISDCSGTDICNNYVCEAQASSCNDVDNDGYGNPGDISCSSGSSQLDCDDNNNLIYPDATEVCNNGDDDDCDGYVDGADPQCIIPSGDVYWVSSTGQATWENCKSATPLDEIAACDYSTANQNADAGDTVYYRGGTYTITSGAAISPSNSGTQGSPIVFSAYPGEVVNFVGGGPVCAVTGISIVNKNWIKVTGYDGVTSARNMIFDGFSYFVNIWDGRNVDGGFGTGSHYNEISYIEFKNDHPGWVIQNCAAESSKLMHNSAYNWIHHNSWHDIGGYMKPGDVNACLNLGWQDCGLYSGGVCEDDTHSNVIEDNEFYHCGHHTVDVINYNNVFRNNVLHNEQWYKNTVTDVTISFTAPDIISDSNSGFGAFNPGDMIVVSGTASNDGTYEVDTVSSGQITTIEQVISTESAGLNIIVEDAIYYGYRTMYLSSEHNLDYHHAYNLIEGNRISHATANKDHNNYGGTGLHLGISYQIIRYNDLYANAGTALYVETHNQATGRINYNHIYNNNFYGNGYGATFPGSDQPGRGASDRSSIWFVASEANYPTMMYGNVVKNNLAYNDYHTSISGAGNGLWAIRNYDKPEDGDSSDDGWHPITSPTCGGSICGDTIFENNWLPSDGDPKFVSLGSYSTPSILTQDYEWYWTSPDGRDITTVNTEPDFTLESDSPVINNGTYLTQANGLGSSSTTLIVDDASYFQPGWGNGAGGGAVVEADWIAIGTVNNFVQIDSINYTSNTITLKSNMDWSAGAPIWLYKDSTGKRVLYGDAPDVGAHEYVSGGGTCAHDADIDCSGCVEFNELDDYVNLWFAGSAGVTIELVAQAIDAGDEC